MNDVWIVGIIGGLGMVAALSVGVSIGRYLKKRSNDKKDQ